MNTINKQALMVYNPFSGKKGSHKAFPMLLQKLSEMGYRLTIHPIKKACQNRWDAIFIAGGDGTVNQSLQFLAAEEYRPTVGVFPFGTSNGFAKYIGMYCNIQALSIIERGNTKQIDIGKFGNLYFANIAAAGWLSDITYKTSPFLKSCFGEWAYCIPFLKTFFLTKQSNTISVDVSTNEVISELSLFLIMNGDSVGPFERLIKNSTHNDGYFHLLTCKKSGYFTISEDIALNLDGEKADVKSLHFNVLPQHLHVFS
ncbi:diacylglycerol kinase family protein [Metabacillus herbersteinensis]|uniref:Diacylglycerol kinase family protein n=1 Tax=Metabacillus herbersteinensis TaxID=283816 RepID=A0ABV6GJU6_9BACI